MTAAIASLRERLSRPGLLVAPGVFDMVSLRLADTFGFDIVRELVNGVRTARIPAVAKPVVDLSAYDRLLETRAANG